MSCHQDGCCPFAFNEASEQAQNYGCLPTPYDIVVMRLQYDKTWACHSNSDKPCQGAINYLNKNGEDSSVIDKQLVTLEDDWSFLCVVNTNVKDYIRSKYWLI